MPLASILRAFQNASESNCSITSPYDVRYNCIAFAAGETHRPWWPMSSPLGYWPVGPTVPDEVTVAAFVAAFETLGYSPCGLDATLEAGYEKVALCTKGDDPLTPTHMAIQFQDGSWASKLGAWEDITHDTLGALEGSEYGHVNLIMKRKSL